MTDQKVFESGAKVVISACANFAPTDRAIDALIAIRVQQTIGVVRHGSQYVTMVDFPEYQGLNVPNAQLELAPARETPQPVSLREGEMAKRLEAATQNIWAASKYDGDTLYTIDEASEDTDEVHFIAHIKTAEDTELILHAPSDLRYTLDQLTSVRREAAAMREALKPFADEADWFKASDADGQTLYSFSGTSRGQSMKQDPAHRLRVFHFRDAKAAFQSVNPTEEK